MLRSRSGDSEWAIVAGLFGLALTLRLSTAAHQSLWADEGFTAQIVMGPLADVVASVRHTESTPPLYYLIERLWVAAAGHSEAALRVPSAIFGAATIFPVYGIAKGLGTRSAGMAAAGLVACSPFLVWYSQEARAYALLTFLSALGLWFFVRLRSRETTANYLGWALCSVLALATHYFAVFPIAIEALLIVSSARRTRTAWGCVAGVAVAFAPLLPLLSYQRDHVSRPWTSSYSLRDQVLATAQEFVGGHTWTPSIHRLVIPALAVILVSVVAIGARTRLAVVRNPVALVAVFTLVAPIALSAIGTNYLAPRNVITAWPAGAVLVGLAATARGNWTRWGVVLTCLAFLAITIMVSRTPSLQRDDWKHLLTATASTSSAVVIADATNDAPVVRYYRPDLHNCTPSTPITIIAIVGHHNVVTQAERSPAFRGPFITHQIQRLTSARAARDPSAGASCDLAPRSVSLVPQPH